MTYTYADLALSRQATPTPTLAASDEITLALARAAIIPAACTES